MQKAGMTMERTNKDNQFPARSAARDGAVYAREYVQHAPIDSLSAGWAQTGRGFPVNDTYQRPNPPEFRAVAPDLSLRGKIEDADRLVRRLQTYWAAVAEDLGPDVWGDPRNEWRQIFTQEISSATKKFEQLVRQQLNQNVGTITPDADAAPVNYELRGLNQTSNHKTNRRLHAPIRAPQEGPMENMLPRVAAVLRPIRAPQELPTQNMLPRVAAVMRRGGRTMKNSYRKSAKARLLNTQPSGSNDNQFATSQPHFPNNSHGLDSRNFIKAMEDRILGLETLLQTGRNENDHCHEVKVEDNIPGYAYNELEGGLSPWSPSVDSARFRGSNDRSSGLGDYECKQEPGPHPNVDLNANSEKLTEHAGASFDARGEEMLQEHEAEWKTGQSNLSSGSVSNPKTKEIMMGTAKSQGVNERISRGFPAENEPLEKLNSAVIKEEIGTNESQRAVLEAAGSTSGNGGKDALSWKQTSPGGS